MVTENPSFVVDLLKSGQVVWAVDIEAVTNEIIGSDKVEPSRGGTVTAL